MNTQIQWKHGIHHFGVIQADVLAALVARRNVQRGSGISPVRLWPAPALEIPPQVSACLCESGVLASQVGDLTPQFAQAADVLAAPRTNVNLRVWSDEGALSCSVLMPGDIRDGMGVALNPVGDDYSVSAFIGADDLWQVINGTFVESLADRLPEAFEAHITAPLAGAMLGAVDLTRRETLTRLACGLPPEVPVFSRQQLCDFVLSTWCRSPLEQLMTAAVTVGAYGRPPGATELAAALDELIAAGMIQRAGADYRCGKELRALAGRTLITERGLQWQRVSLVSGGELAMCSCVILSTGGSQQLSFQRSAGGKVFLRCITRDELVEFLADELTGATDLRRK